MPPRDPKHTNEFTEEVVVFNPSKKEQARLEKQLRKDTKTRQREEQRRAKVQAKIDKQQAKAEKQREKELKIARRNARRNRYSQNLTFEKAFYDIPRLNMRAGWQRSSRAVVVSMVLFALLAVVVVDDSTLVNELNTQISSAIQSLRGGIDTLVILLTRLGDFLPMLGVVLITVGVLYVGYKWDSIVFFVGNVFLALITVNVLKLLFLIPRPDGETLVAIPNSFSFPSSHSFMSVIILGMIGLLFYRAFVRLGMSRKDAMIPGIALLIVAVLIGLSRIYVGVHWPTDVLGGWLLGVAWLAFAGGVYIAPLRKMPKKTFARTRPIRK